MKFNSTRPILTSTRRLALLLAAAICLCSLSAFADPQLSLSLSQSGGAYDCSTLEGPSFNYNNSLTAPPGTSLSDSQSNSEGGYASVASAADVFYGSCHFDGSAAAVETTDPGILGGAGSNAAAAWTTQLHINSPGMDGQPVTVRITLHASGDASGATSSYYSNSNYSYNYSVSDYQTSAAFAGGWDAQNGWTGDGQPIRTFTFDANCTSGQPCEIAHSASFGISAGTGEPDFGDPQSCNAQGSGSLSFSSGNVQVLDPNNDNQPVSFTMVSDTGCGAGQVTPAGAPYAGFSVTNCAQDRFGSTFQLLDGTASQNTDVTATFVAPEEIKAASDVVDLKGTDGDLQVVQISYDPDQVNGIGGLGVYFGICFLPFEGGKKWESAMLGNYNGPPPTWVGDRAYNPATDFHLGYQGYDSANHVAWAVINHNSLFAAAIPFDLVSVVSRKTHGGAGTFDINMPLTGTPGVECRNSGGNHILVFTFKSNLASGEVSVTSGGGNISGMPTMSGNVMTVNLTNVPNAQRTTLMLHNMKDVANQELPDTSVTVGFLVGDTTGNGSVNGSDVSQTKSQSGQAVSATNFRTDVNTNGSINGSDVSLVKSKTGTALP
jgi:hypothetical protein